MGEHTKGPWETYDLDPTVIINSEGSSLGDMTPGDPFITGVEAFANARLAAAAPDLLEALEEAVWTYEGILDDEGDECGADEDHPLCGAKSCELSGCIVDKLSRARAAIAKARGQ